MDEREHRFVAPAPHFGERGANGPFDRLEIRRPPQEEPRAFGLELARAFVDDSQHGGPALPRRAGSDRGGLCFSTNDAN